MTTCLNVLLDRAIGGSAYFWRQGNASLRALSFVLGQPNTLDFTLRIRKGRNSYTRPCPGW